MGNRFETQDKLIAATRKIIIEEGMEATKLEHICKVAGFSRGAFYSNFISKDDLLTTLAQDEYDGLVSRLRQTIATWDTRSQSESTQASTELQIESLLFEALDAIGVNQSLYVLNSEMLMRSLRDPKWGAQLLDANNQFIAELGNALQWILDAANRERTQPLRAMTHAVIGVVMRAASIDSWRKATNATPETLASNTSPSTSQGPLDTTADASLSAADSSAKDILMNVLLILHASSKPIQNSDSLNT